MRVSPERVTALLTHGQIESLGLMPNASNYTFAVRVSYEEMRALAIYKPRDGETPLWDFPEGTLFAREMAAFEIGTAMGWELVPLTVVRNGPHGIGSLQLFIDAQPDRHYLTMMPDHADVFRRVCAFDIVINNADRKSGHCLLERGSGHVWAVDHGVSFHVEDKLRTVIWDFIGEPLPDDVRAGLQHLLDAFAAGGDLCRRLEALLAPEEIAAVRARADALLRADAYPPLPDDRRPYPWPPI